MNGQTSNVTTLAIQNSLYRSESATATHADGAGTWSIGMTNAEHAEEPTITYTQA